MNYSRWIQVSLKLQTTFASFSLKCTKIVRTFCLFWGWRFALQFQNLRLSWTRMKLLMKKLYGMVFFAQDSGFIRGFLIVFWLFFSTRASVSFSLFSPGASGYFYNVFIGNFWSLFVVIFFSWGFWFFFECLWSFLWFFKTGNTGHFRMFTIIFVISFYPGILVIFECSW